MILRSLFFGFFLFTATESSGMKMKKICFVLSFVIICSFVVSFTVCAETYSGTVSGTYTETIKPMDSEVEKAVSDMGLLGGFTKNESGEYVYSTNVEAEFSYTYPSQKDGSRTYHVDSSGNLRVNPVGLADKIGTYRINPETGEKEYLMFWTYAACMSYMGNEEYCASGAHCYHQ